ncbi:hypothetical protein Poli38472_012368 [Pythium oligandrum]|uniref:Uncharacterized protein n=1 Tax=Pythium oligandrum TaxID=41045 RepID=A0A8K1CPA1_PYTOL|nr:hypothetical protein Poli38472_012368 [Pythium oligandrum]|eukprot:TMW67252.1 hypothetical protein Poli38472_012368 [Pythium oligandrum]
MRFWDESTSNEPTSDSSSSLSWSPEPSTSSQNDTAGRKKRKPTYYVRKEESATLQAEVEELRQRLEAIEAKKRQEKEEMAQSLAVKTFLHAQVMQNTRAMANMQAMLSAYHASGAAFPLETYIHLTADADQRRQTLFAMRDQKVREATEYIIERTGPMDLRRPHCAAETSFTPTGDYAFSQFDVTIFPNVRGVQQVFEAIRNFFQYQELSLSENLGVITIRESDDDDGSKDPVFQTRLMATLPSGQEVESNSATFFKYHERSDLLDTPHALFINESIKRDDLYPYKENRHRLRLMAVTMLTETPSGSKNACGPGRVNVTMTRSCCGFIHRAVAGVESEVEAAAQSYITNFREVMARVIREHLRLHG